MGPVSTTSDLYESRVQADAPVFSIITPTCRRPSLLRRNILSVRNQTFKDYEHIIVDDGAEEGTEEIIKETGDSRITLIRHQTSRGAAAGYNAGIRAAKGRYILFLDDDDEYMPDFLEKMFSEFSTSGEDVGFIWTGITRVEDNETGEKFIQTTIWPSSFRSRESGLVEATSIGNGFGVCVRRECIDEIGLYDESLLMGQDTDYLLRLASRFNFRTIPEPLVKIHRHGTGQLTVGDNNHLRIKYREQILSKNADLLRQYPELFRAHYKSLTKMCYRSGFRKQGRQAIYSVIKNNPFRIMDITDLVFYELVGKDAVTFYFESRFRKLFRRLQGRKETGD